MSEPAFDLVDRGDVRLLRFEGHEYATRYSEKLVRMLIARKGVRRTPPYFRYKEARGDHFLGLQSSRRQTTR